ncbi:hypothetical protein M0R72_12400 [Candidatus Pacearchaeota archaeon]|jgi:hypothetical protein|nr:hypothetical protein [Candidatus Pacearchaeota archaeon]
MRGYWRLGPATFGRDTDFAREAENFEFAYMRIWKFQIVCEWRIGWKELSFAWG